MKHRDHPVRHVLYAASCGQEPTEDEIRDAIPDTTPQANTLRRVLREHAKAAAAHRRDGNNAGARTLAREAGDRLVEEVPAPHKARPEDQTDDPRELAQLVPERDRGRF